MTETTVTDSAEPVELIEFSVGCARTINLGNYQSLKIEATVTMEVHEETNMEELRATAQKELRRLLEETYTEQYAKHKKAEKSNGTPY